MRASSMAVRRSVTFTSRKPFSGAANLFMLFAPLDRSAVGRVDDLALDDVLGQEPDRPADKAPTISRGGRLRAGQSDQLGLFRAVENRCDLRRFALLADQHRVEALLDAFGPPALAPKALGATLVSSALAILSSDQPAPASP